MAFDNNRQNGIPSITIDHINRHSKMIYNHHIVLFSVFIFGKITNMVLAKDYECYVFDSHENKGKHEAPKIRHCACCGSRTVYIDRTAIQPRIIQVQAWCQCHSENCKDSYDNHTAVNFCHGNLCNRPDFGIITTAGAGVMDTIDKCVMFQLSNNVLSDNQYPVAVPRGRNPSFESDGSIGAERYACYVFDSHENQDEVFSTECMCCASRIKYRSNKSTVPTVIQIQAWCESKSCEPRQDDHTTIEICFDDFCNFHNFTLRTAGTTGTMDRIDKYVKAQLHVKRVPSVESIPMAVHHARRYSSGSRGRPSGRANSIGACSLGSDGSCRIRVSSVDSGSSLRSGGSYRRIGSIADSGKRHRSDSSSRSEGSTEFFSDDRGDH